MNEKKFSILFELSLLGCLISSVSLMLIPVFGLFSNKISNVFCILIAILFWIGLVMNAVCFLRVNAIRKSNSDYFSSKYKNNPVKKIGLLNYLQNREAVFADVLLIVMLILFVLANIIDSYRNVFFFVTFGGLFLLFNMHCYFNGKNYYLYKKIKKMRSGLNEQI